MLKVSFLLLIVIVNHIHGGIVKKQQRAGGPSDLPISTTVPNFPGGSIANDAPPGPFFQDFQPPFPTDAWWSGFTVSNQDSTVAGPFPFQVSTGNNGMRFGIASSRRFDGTSIHVDTQFDFSISFTGLPSILNNRKATAWDTQTVSLQYFSGGTTMDTYLVPGSPYMTFKFTNAEFVLTSLIGDIDSFEWIVPGSKGKITAVDGATVYILYVIEGSLSNIIVGATTLTSTPNFSGTIRLAKITNESQEPVLDAHASSYATGVTMSYSVEGDISTQRWEWDVVGNADNLLLLNWPHHRKVLQAPINVPIEYLTIKGYMRGVRGNVWTQRHNLPTISWFPSNNPHASCVPQLIKTLESDVAKLQVMVPGDFYFWGGAFGRAAQLATIGEHVGRMDLVEKVVNILKESVEFWFDPAHVPAAAFETGWGGFINKEGWNNTWVDFGNAYYNDHHFHYGYILHGAAVIGKYDQAWFNQHLDFFTHIARNYGNPSPNDPHYTVTRHFDFFAGHSWASGIANGAGPRDQESSGEAINGYYGLLLFATAANNGPLVDWARLLIAMEIEGAQAYWHLYPTINDPDSPYPEQELRDLVTIGNVMDTQAGAWLFWGADKTQIAAIQILPLTPIGEVNFDAPWMEEVLKYCKVELDDPKYDDAFKSVIYAAYAKVNPQEAFSYSEGLFDWGTGNSASNQLYFISTQSSSSDICSASAQSPEGNFTIQDSATGKYVTLSGNGELKASGGADVLGAKFSIEFTPGGSNLKALSNGKYVTAGPGGTTPLSAVRDTAQSYEVFRFEIQPDGSYTLKAMVNRELVGTGPGGELVNDGSGATYKLTPAEETPPPSIPTFGKIKSVGNDNYVVSTQAVPTLYATTNLDGGTTFDFEPVPNTNNYAIRSRNNGMAVTADVSGTAPLAALRLEAQAWEHFQIVPYRGAYILIHVVSGKAVALQPDNTLIDNDADIGNGSLWTIE